MGTQNVKFLTRYRVIKDDKTSHARTTRAIKDIHICNSFNFTISTINSCVDVEERILGVHVRDVDKNIDKNEFKCLQLDQLAIVKNSNKWMFSKKEFKGKKFSKSCNKEGSIVTKYFSIKPMLDNYVPFNLDRSSDNPLNPEQPTSHVEINFEEPPYSDFIDHEYKFFKNVTKTLKENKNKELDTASIAISWNIYKEGVYDIKGFQCIFGIIMNKEVVSDIQFLDDVRAIDNPLVFSVNFPRIVNSDFENNPFCIVKLSLEITNILSNQAVTFCIETEQNKHVKDKNDYFWTGVSKKNIRSCKPNEIINLDFIACFTETGVYDLNDFIVTLFKDPSTGNLLQNSEEKRRCYNSEIVTKRIEQSQFIIKVK